MTQPPYGWPKDLQYDSNYIANQNINLQKLSPLCRAALGHLQTMLPHERLSYKQIIEAAIYKYMLERKDEMILITGTTNLSDSEK